MYYASGTVPNTTVLNLKEFNAELHFDVELHFNPEYTIRSFSKQSPNKLYSWGPMICSSKTQLRRGVGP